MKKTTFISWVSVLLTLVLLAGIALTGCQQRRNHIPKMASNPLHDRNRITTDSDSLGQYELDEYTAHMSADTLLKIPGKPGKLLFSIGIPGHIPSFIGWEGLGHDEVTFPARGRYAKIQISAPAFEIRAADKKLEDNTMIVAIDPTGSEFFLSIVPLTTGRSEISATVFMHNLPDCSDPGVSKVPPILKINVRVDRWSKCRIGINKMLDILWEKFLDFWAAFVALFLGLMLYFVRKAIKKKTGYSGKDDS